MYIINDIDCLVEPGWGRKNCVTEEKGRGGLYDILLDVTLLDDALLDDILDDLDVVVDRGVDDR